MSVYTSQILSLRQLTPKSLYHPACTRARTCSTRQEQNVRKYVSFLLRSLPYIPPEQTGWGSRCGSKATLHDQMESGVQWKLV